MTNIKITELETSLFEELSDAESMAVVGGSILGTLYNGTVDTLANTGAGVGQASGNIGDGVNTLYGTGTGVGATLGPALINGLRNLNP